MADADTATTRRAHARGRRAAKKLVRLPKFEAFTRFLVVASSSSSPILRGLAKIQWGAKGIIPPCPSACARARQLPRLRAWRLCSGVRPHSDVRARAKLAAGLCAPRGLTPLWLSNGTLPGQADARSGLSKKGAPPFTRASALLLPRLCWVAQASAARVRLGWQRCLAPRPALALTTPS